MKKGFTTLFIISASYLFFAYTALGKNIGDSILRLGNGVAQNIFIYSNQPGDIDPFIKFDSTDSKWKFSNDGATEKTFGSGSGGGSGVNFLAEANADFEAGTDSWTASGGVFVAETTTPLDKIQSGSWTANALAQTLESQLIPVNPGFAGAVGRVCQAKIDYKATGISSGDYKFQIVDQTSAVVATIDLDPTTGDGSRPSVISTDCPSLAGSYKIRIESGIVGPTTLIIDNAFLGYGYNSLSVSQTELVAFASYKGTASCTWARNSSTYGDFVADADCPAITVHSSTQAVNTADDDLPNIVFDNLMKGKYEVTASIPFTGNVLEAHTRVVRITDSSSSANDITGVAPCVTSKGTGDGNALDLTTIVCTSVFEYSDSGPRNFRIQSLEGGSGSAIISADNNGRDLTWKVVKYPTEVSEAITLETSGYHVDVNIGGANPSLGLVSQASYFPIGSSTLDLVINPGSAPAKILCDDGTATGLTCSGPTEHVGIAFDVPAAGRYQVCFEGIHSSRLNAIGTAIDMGFQLIENPIGSPLVVLQEGNSRSGIANIHNIPAGVDQQYSNTIRTCGNFTFNSVGEKHVRLMYEQQVTGAVLANLLVADRSAIAGQRDFHFTVEKLDEQKPTPVFTDLKNSLSNKVGTKSGFPEKVLVAARINNAGTPTLSDDQSGASSSWISGLTDNGTGQTNILYQSGVFNGVDVPICSCTTNSNNTSCISTLVGPSSIQINTLISTTASFIDTSFDIICIGLK